MKLFTKIKLSYILICIIPIALMVVAIFGSSLYSQYSLQSHYDIQNADLSTVYNPISLIGNVNTKIVQELMDTIHNEPEKLDEEAYLKQINERLSEESAFLAVRIDGEIVFDGSVDKISFDKASDSIDATNGRLMYVGETPYHVRDLVYKNDTGERSELIVMTDISRVVPSFKNTLLEALIGIGFILLLAGVVIVLWLYRSIIKPIGVLKTAAQNITKGNLDFEIKSDSKDEIGELSNTFEEMRLRLKEQNDLNLKYQKDNRELISSISHDLKTPITSIKGYVDGIIDGVADTPEKKERYLRTIYTKAGDMEKLIEELSLYSKIENNAIPYSFTKLNISEYFDDCADEISLDLEEHGIELRYLNDVDRSVVIIADPEQLKRVITNIVHNSIKYIGKEHGFINLRLKEEAEFVEIVIEDNGVGINAKELPHIFDRFYRTDASRNSSTGGSGLGLAICKKIIEEHGGKIWATSKVGEGTAMHFVLRKYFENGTMNKEDDNE